MLCWALAQQIRPNPHFNKQTTERDRVPHQKHKEVSLMCLSDRNYLVSLRPKYHALGCV